MSQRKEPFVHPYLFFLINRGLDDIVTTARTKDYDTALEYLLWFFPYLEPAIKQDLQEDFDKMWQTLINGRGHVSPDLLLGFMNKISNKIHEKGYILAAKSRPPTREKSMKELELTVSKAQYAQDREKPS